MYVTLRMPEVMDRRRPAHTRGTVSTSSSCSHSNIFHLTFDIVLCNLRLQLDSMRGTRQRSYPQSSAPFQQRHYSPAAQPTE
jgi:hypothetical protein